MIIEYHAILDVKHENMDVPIIPIIPLFMDVILLAALFYEFEELGLNKQLG